MSSGEGQEILIIDSDPKIQKGLEHLLRTAGLNPTIISDPAHAIEMAVEKFFAVVLVDIDTPTTEAGLGTIEELRRKTPATAVIALSPRRAFDAGVKAFRIGAHDVVVKTPDQVAYLRDKVVELAEGKKREAANERLLEQALAFHEELMKVLVDTYRKSIELEEKVAGGQQGGGGVSVLLVEEDGWLGGQLSVLLEEKGGYALQSVATGGEALDLAGRERCHVALVKESLPDLPGSMVVRSIKAQSPDTMVLLFNPPGDRPGSITVIQGDRSDPFVPEFTDVKQLADRLGEVKETIQVKRYVVQFRQQHFELLKKYAELRQRLERGIAK